MAKTRLRIPIRLIITVILLFVLGAVAGPVIQSLATPEQMDTNVLLGAIPFILIFAAIVLTFIAIIVIASGLLSNNIAPRVYRLIESVLIAGIVLGVVGMFQPWLFILYKYGFLVLLVSTLSFILWSHIVPKGVVRQEDLSSISVSELEASE